MPTRTGDLAPKKTVAKYSGFCKSCGEQISAGETVYLEKTGGRWLVEHPECHGDE